MKVLLGKLARFGTVYHIDVSTNYAETQIWIYDFDVATILVHLNGFVIVSLRQWFLLFGICPIS